MNPHLKTTQWPHCGGFLFHFVNAL